MIPPHRKLVFISHANPEDNEFTLWLASRLTCHGYSVWSDLTKLIGAEIFWDDIDDAIRNHAAKVIVALSTAAQSKQGVLDETHLAVNVERAHKWSEFVVPLRIDELPFLEIKPNLARKNVIDFTPGWADGLKRLLKVLERDCVPKSSSKDDLNLDDWFRGVRSPSDTVLAEPMQLASNRIKMEVLPEKLHFYRIPIRQQQVRNRFAKFPFPVFPYSDMLATFAEHHEIDDYLGQFQKATKSFSIPVTSLIDGTPHSLPKLRRTEGVNLLTSLIREAWDNEMQSRAFLPYEMANGRKAWFPTEGYAVGDWVRFVDLDGKPTKKRLMGRSNKYGVNWHFAAQAHPIIGRECRMLLKPHVVFTENGRTPLASSRRMHRLRRGFCKSWFNENWRRLIFAYLVLLGDKEHRVRVPVSSETDMIFSAQPEIFVSPVSLPTIETNDDSDDTDEALDAKSDYVESEDEEQTAGIAGVCPEAEDAQ